MGLRPCGECGHQVSDKAAVCPSCGAPVNPTATVGQIAAAVSGKVSSMVGRLGEETILPERVGGLPRTKWTFNTSSPSQLYRALEDCLEGLHLEPERVTPIATAAGAIGETATFFGALAGRRRRRSFYRWRAVAGGALLLLSSLLFAIPMDSPSTAVVSQPPAICSDADGNPIACTDESGNPIAIAQAQLGGEKDDKTRASVYVWIGGVFFVISLVLLALCLNLRSIRVAVGIEGESFRSFAERQESGDKRGATGVVSEGQLTLVVGVGPPRSSATKPGDVRAVLHGGNAPGWSGRVRDRRLRKEVDEIVEKLKAEVDELLPRVTMPKAAG